MGLGKGRRDGTAFILFVSIYAAGRFAIEFLRGDQHRGQAWGLSTAQWVSVALLIALAAQRWLPGPAFHAANPARAESAPAARHPSANEDVGNLGDDRHHGRGPLLPVGRA
jgi:hypothetical protein